MQFTAGTTVTWEELTKTVEDVKSFFRELTVKHNLNFHPDTPFEDFDVLTKTQAKALNKKMDKAFKICEKEKADIYEIGLEIFHERLVIKDKKADAEN